MSVAETVLIYGVIPLGVVAVLVILIWGPSVTRRRPRWKSGQPWPHDPVWYEPHPMGGAEGHGESHGAGQAELGAGAHAALTQGPAGEPEPASAGGPLGGARGTW